MKSKKAQGMPMNVIIIAIIVLVVLIIVIAFFAGGFSSIVNKVRDLFTGQTSGQQRDIIVQTCQNLCDTGATLPSDTQLDSGFCKQTFVVDHDSNPNTKPQRMGCSHSPTPDPNDEKRGVSGVGKLGVSCPDVSC